jgi:hypothetical protein
MSKPQIIQHKSGDHFEFQATYKDGNDVPVALNNVSIKSQIRSSDGVLLSEARITKLDQFYHPGEYSLAVSRTSHWEANKILIWDIQYTEDGKVTSTETMNIQVLLDVTQ